jgi:prepilin-type N-terminal cleavage/methylation domain-containing protein
MKLSKGFTLIEIILVISVAVLLAGVMVFPLTKFRDNKLLISTSEVIYSVLNEARSNTTAAKNDFQYGIHFESNSATLFRGTTYSAGDANNEKINLQNVITLSQISLNGGGSDVLFNRLTGSTNNFGSLKVQLTKDSSVFRTINIEKTGVVTIVK